MANKNFLVLVMASLVATGAFAVPEFRLSFGVGGYLTWDMGGVWVSSADESIGKVGCSSIYNGGGGLLFFDATFVELSLGFFGGNTIWGTESSMDYTLAGLDIGIMGKYPFTLGTRFTLFPQLGIIYRVILDINEENNAALEPSDFSALLFRLGIGADFSITNQIYLRGGATAGIRLQNKFEKDMIDNYNSWYKSQDVTINVPPNLGWDFKLAVGFRF